MWSLDVVVGCGRWMWSLDVVIGCGEWMEEVLRLSSTLMVIGRDRVVIDRHVVWIADVDAGFVAIGFLHALPPPMYTAIVL